MKLRAAKEMDPEFCGAVSAVTLAESLPAVS
jgi:hypothetical protein